jgi:hypothetical protein
MSDQKKPGAKRRPVHSKGKPADPNFDPLPAELLRQYPGQYIIYSEEEGRVIGAGSTEDEAFEQARASGVGGLWHSGYSEWSEKAMK